jgi:hypothetical protein
MTLRVLLSALLLSLLPYTAEANGWRCGDRLINTGDFALEVRARCGEPAQVERRQRLKKIRDERGRERSKLSEIEEWSYRQDGNELMRTLVFIDGRLQSIYVGGRAPTDTRKCERQMFSKGTPGAELKLTCGEPASRDEWIEHVERELADGTIVGISVIHERVIYNFGPDRFLRIFELVDGRLVKQSTGGYGF